MRKKQIAWVLLVSIALLSAGCLNRQQPGETPETTGTLGAESFATSTAASTTPATIMPTPTRQFTPTQTPTRAALATPTPAPTATYTPVPILTSANGGSLAGFTARGEPSRGDPAAPVVFEEFSSYQCGFCARYFAESFAQVIADYVETGQVLYVFRDFPLPSQPQSTLAAGAANCAGELGGASTYWAMHDILFQRQTEWSGRGDAGDIFTGYAGELELDEAAFDRCLDSDTIQAQTQADVAEAVARGVRGTPTFLINDQPVVGAQPYSVIASAIDAALEGPTTAGEIELAPLSAFPPSFAQLPSQVQEAYRFALANQDVLEKIPCYCGCNQMGHMNNRMCYIKSVEADGRIILDDHAVA